MKLAIMQPYFFPYIGYFQLMKTADIFVIYDNIEYSKNGWINRNRILVNGKDVYITVPLKKDSDFLHICGRSVADSWNIEKRKMLSRIKEAYRKAPCFEDVYPIVKLCIECCETNLFIFLLNSITIVCEYLEIQTPVVISSTLSINHKLKSQDKVIEICKAVKAGTYINPIGGVHLYRKQEFQLNGIDLQFLKPNSIVYPQLGNLFVPSLSIIDVMMFNEKKIVFEFLNSGYTLIESDIAIPTTEENREAETPALTEGEFAANLLFNH